MSVISMKQLLKHARSNRYAVGYFESWNMDSVLAVADAAARTQSPVIIGFGGLFLGNPRRRTEENIRHYGALARAVAEDSPVPMAILLNEADRMPMLIKALGCGFNAVMYQDPAVSFEETLKANQYLVPIAHAFGADVEAEVGELPCADITSGNVSQGQMTDPEQALRFVKETGIDALAIAVGNVHLLEGENASLDFDLIEKIHRSIDIPLVLHGGTGLSPDSLKHAIELGMCKINVGTALKRIYINSLHNYLKVNPVNEMNIHEIVGIGGEHDMLCAAREEVACKIAEMMESFGCAGRAGELAR
ncbi:fructose-bisphosphate aldolase [Spirochaetia bacterium]|nr:fructose-bisphosphate aldolase [Spirochaetia bacterium]